MRLVSFFPDRETDDSNPVAGILVGDTIVDIPVMAAEAGLDWLTEDLDLGDLLRMDLYDDEVMAGFTARAAELTGGETFEDLPLSYKAADATLAAPVPIPTSFRDFYAFEQHVKAARAGRGLEMIPEFYEAPVFYFSNHNAIIGPGEDVVRPRASNMLDFELEIACIIAREGIDLTVEEAEDHILGYTILNDWSARDLQRKEMVLNLGPAKGKDFASSLGPWVVTLDELADRAVGDGRYDLAMLARVNGRQVSEGNFKDITFPFPRLIAHASADTWILPGDVMGSGTVGTGCILELGPDKVPWLEPGDVVELEIERLGVLSTTVAAPE